MVEFKAEKIGNEIVVKPIIVRNGNNVTIKVPSLKLIKELKEKHGKRNIQPIQSKPNE